MPLVRPAPPTVWVSRGSLPRATAEDILATARPAQSEAAAPPPDHRTRLQPARAGVGHDAHAEASTKMDRAHRKQKMCRDRIDPRVSTSHRGQPASGCKAPCTGFCCPKANIPM